MSPCYFCREDGENPYSFKICDLKYSTLYLFREQIYRGRCILAAKRHAAEYYDLPAEEAAGFMEDLTLVSRTLERLFKPDKMNYASIGDSSGHLHIHVVPKHRDNERWGDMFEVNAHRGYLDQEEYQSLIIMIKQALDAALQEGEGDNDND